MNNKVKVFVEGFGEVYIEEDATLEDLSKKIYGEEYKNYQRVVFIHIVGDSEEYVKYSREVADFLKVKHWEVQGSQRYFEKLVKGEWDKEFLIIPPGETVSLQSFI